MILTIGTKYSRTDFKSIMKIVEIVTHKKALGGKKVKLERELYMMEYDKWVTKTETKKVTVPMFKEDILKQLSYGTWRRII